MPRKRAAATKKWRLYVLRCADETLYCGISNDVNRRLAQHSSGKGARYTRGRGPLVLLKSWPAASHSAALRAERAFKRLSRLEKEAKILSRTRNDPVSKLLRSV
jgi:putative endonuclease